MPRPCLLRLRRVPAGCARLRRGLPRYRRQCPARSPAGPPAGPAARRCHLQGVRMVSQGSSFTTRPQLAGTFGMVASTHWLASAAGLAVLEAGGNAFDAAVAAWLVLLQRYGRLGLRDVMQYAIGYARDGYPMLPGASAGIASVAGLFGDHWPSSAEIYLADGVPSPGSRFANPVLAATYQRVLDEAEAAGSARDGQIEAARRAFYDGFVAEAITAYTQRAEAMEPGSAEFMHTVVECAKLAFADREAWYGDPRFGEVPVAGLLSAEYAAQRRALVGAEASGDLVPGAPGGMAPRLPGYATGDVQIPYGAGSGEPTMADTGAGASARPVTGLRGPGDTCHLDVADRFGNVVTATPSGGWLQSSPVIPGLGFCLGTRAQMFTLTPGLPNTLAPGKRPRTTLSPSLALRDGEPYLAFGTPGGDQQDQWTLAFFVNHVLFGMNLQEAIDAPAFHTRHFPSSFWPRESYPRAVDVEDRAGPDVIEGLRARGHEVTVSAPWSLGRVSAVARDGGTLYAAANARGMQGYAVGR